MPSTAQMLTPCPACNFAWISASSFSRPTKFVEPICTVLGICFCSDFSNSPKASCKTSCNVSRFTSVKWIPILAIPPVTKVWNPFASPWLIWINWRSSWIASPKCELASMPCFTSPTNRATSAWGLSCRIFAVSWHSCVIKSDISDHL